MKKIYDNDRDYVNEVVSKGVKAKRGKQMKITNSVELNRQYEMVKSAEGQTAYQGKEMAVESDKEVKVSLSAEQKGKTVLTDEELEVAVQNALAMQSDINSVEEAERMIAAVNKKVLTRASEAMLAQANQTPPVVAELTK